MADIKLESDYWEASGIRDRTQNKTQRQINEVLQGSLNSEIDAREKTQKIIAPVITSLTATEALTRQDFRIYNNELYLITQNIASGDNIIVGTNAEKIDLASLLKPRTGNCTATDKVKSNIDTRWLITGFIATVYCSFTLATSVNTNDELLTDLPASLWPTEVIGIVVSANSDQASYIGKALRFRKMSNGALVPWYNTVNIPAGLTIMAQFSFNIGG